MTRLHQFNALIEGFKAEENREFDRAYHAAQKPPLFAGLSRTYAPRAEDGDHLPPEGTRVQVTAEDLLANVRGAFGKLLDAELTQDWANSQAKADVVADGTTILKDVPVTNLLRLEKQIVHLRTLVDALPVLDPADDWEWDEARACHTTTPAKTVRTKKVPRNHVLSEATKEHPAQVQAYYEDEPVGDWTLVKFSGALTAVRKRELLQRVLRLQAAVRLAREQANTFEVQDRKAGDPVFDYLLA
jgi:hypothetical protein